MGWMALGKIILAFAFVIALLLGIAWVLRKVGIEKRLRLGTRGGTLRLEETLFLDPTHKVVVVGREARRYVVLVGEHHDLLLETYDEPEEEDEDDV